MRREGRDSYTITIGGGPGGPELTRELKLVPITLADGRRAAIASFDLLAGLVAGDTELIEHCARAFAADLPGDVDWVVGIEAQGIALAHALALALSRPPRWVRSFILRKGGSRKPHMGEVLTERYRSITTPGEQELLLSAERAAWFRGRRIVLVDDVCSTGGSLRAAEALIARAGGNIVARCAALLQAEHPPHPLAGQVRSLGFSPLFTEE